MDQTTRRRPGTVGDGGDELVRFGDVDDVAVCGKIACWKNPEG